MHAVHRGEMMGATQGGAGREHHRWRVPGLPACKDAWHAPPMQVCKCSVHTPHPGGVPVRPVLTWGAAPPPPRPPGRRGRTAGHPSCAPPGPPPSPQTSTAGAVGSLGTAVQVSRGEMCDGGKGWARPAGHMATLGPAQRGVQGPENALHFMKYMQRSTHLHVLQVSHHVLPLLDDLQAVQGVRRRVDFSKGRGTQARGWAEAGSEGARGHGRSRQHRKACFLPHLLGALALAECAGAVAQEEQGGVIDL